MATTASPPIRLMAARLLCAVVLPLLWSGCEAEAVELVREIAAARGECTRELLERGDEECVRMMERYTEIGTDLVHTYIGGLRTLDQALDRMPPPRFDTGDLGYAISPELRNGDPFGPGASPRLLADNADYRVIPASAGAMEPVQSRSASSYPLDRRALDDSRVSGPDGRMERGGGLRDALDYGGPDRWGSPSRARYGFLDSGAYGYYGGWSRYFESSPYGYFYDSPYRYGYGNDYGYRPDYPYGGGYGNGAVYGRGYGYDSRYPYGYDSASGYGSAYGYEPGYGYDREYRYGPGYGYGGAYGYGPGDAYDRGRRYAPASPYGSGYDYRRRSAYERGAGYEDPYGYYDPRAYGSPSDIPRGYAYEPDAYGQEPGRMQEDMSRDDPAAAPYFDDTDGREPTEFTPIPARPAPHRPGILLPPEERLRRPWLDD